MIFRETELKGAYLIEPERMQDERGYFARTWCRRELEEHGLNSSLAQCGTSYNKSKSTLRGMHFQAAPHAEAKLIRCTRGSIWDVIIDLRGESATYKRYTSATLSGANGFMLYVPEGFAHGFQTLEDEAEVLYQMSEFYRPEAARGVRWNDPAFAIEWPAADRRIISERDNNWPDFTG
jgi:dTDP-4-dehydrorhamnose 3,5-epimerase